MSVFFLYNVKTEFESGFILYDIQLIKEAVT